MNDLRKFITNTKTEDYSSDFEPAVVTILRHCKEVYRTTNTQGLIEHMLNHYNADEILASDFFDNLYYSDMGLPENFHMAIALDSLLNTIDDYEVGNFYLQGDYDRLSRDENIEFYKEDMTRLLSKTEIDPEDRERYINFLDYEFETDVEYLFIQSEEFKKFDYITKNKIACIFDAEFVDEKTLVSVVVSYDGSFDSINWDMLQELLLTMPPVDNPGNEELIQMLMHANYEHPVMHLIAVSLKRALDTKEEVMF